ncbi:MAG: acetoin dehydrogenase dihydrolipoyllysine-residue acetyltransferase subunit [Bauldia sp.]|nr:acetoin dehydrogenase dihydrolipoyllysine-residue acetyltransferase subunit [Bauldia sp.]
MPAIQAITMPKWGLAMEEGMLARWAVEEGASIALAEEIMDIETSKIANVFESPVAGVLRRKVVGEGDTVPVGALLGVVTEGEVSDAEIDAFVADFLASFTTAVKEDVDAPSAEPITVEGRTIRHLCLGPDDGTPILMIHGFGADLATWMFNQEALAADRPVYAIDLPGHGGSSKQVDDGSVEGLARTVKAYMDAAGIERAHLVGHSLGGAIAVEIAGTAPDRVAALTLVAPAGLGPEIATDFIEGFISETRSRKLRPVLEMLVANPGMVSADMVEDVLKFKRLDGAPAALRTIADANFGGGSQKASLRDRLATVKVPVQVVWGEEDRILPARHAEGLPATVSVTRLPGVGHIAHMEKASEINSVIKSVH